MNNGHRWHFFRAGGFDQVKLDRGADLVHLDQLDQKLWVALACPTRGIEFDIKTLDLIDTDKDGRIRAPEIIAAAKWAAGCLKNSDDLLKCSASLPLSAINDGTPDGKQMLASAREILANLGKKDATAITVEDSTDTAKIFAQTNFNGDGIVPADAASDAAVKAVINDIIACLGAETDRSGKPGISQAKADQFFAEAQAYSDWWKKAEGDKAVLPLGDATPGAAATMKTVKAKVDDYFARCRLAAFDARALGALNRQETEYLALAAKDLTITAAEVAGFPLARIEAGKALPLTTGVNPAWADALAKLQAEVVKPLLGDKPVLNEADWAALADRFAAYEAWAAGKAGASVEKLGIKRVREILSSQSKEAITALIAKDKSLAAEFNSIAAVDRLVRYNRDLHKLLINFVNFKDFYDRGDPAVFQAGTLYLDQRSCELTMLVDDAAKHAAMAGLAGAYLAYCDCVRRSTGEKRQIVAVFTNGDSDNLMVGRNGIFYDRQGRDWDATITKIIDNPISLRQAFWAPYKKFVRVIEEQIAKRAAAAEAASDQKLATTAQTVTTADKPKPVEQKKVDVGAVAAMGVAFGAIGTALAYVLGLFKGLQIWQLPLVIAGIMFLISLPSLILAYIKLRKRNLGPILDANGWAVNARARINIPFGRSLTGVAVLPDGAQRDMSDPYAESNKGRNNLIALLVLALVVWGVWYFGFVEKAVPDVFPKSQWMKKREQKAAAAAQQPAPAPAAPVPAEAPPAK
jgi:hypothetical protein